MKAIDLLNKIAKGEEVPKKIKYDGEIYIYESNGVVLDEFNYYSVTNGFLYNVIDFENHLNDEVEIIEEEKEISKITKEEFERLDKRTLLELIVKNQNEIIDKLNDMRDKE